MSINNVGRPRTPAFAIGTKFKHLTVVGTSTRKDVYGYDVEYYKCQCECGRVQEKSKTSLRTKPDTKCRECAGVDASRTKQLRKPRFPKERQTWKAMMERCSDIKHPAYPRYGGRGIGVCDRWHTFENFIADMGRCPEAMSIERVDNDKGYSPDNCKWATTEEQQRNRRSNRNMTANGKTQLLIDWAKELGTKPSTIWARVELYGWTEQDACTTPVAKRK